MFTVEFTYLFIKAMSVCVEDNFHYMLNCKEKWHNLLEKEP